jgi:hypothetical protein
MLMAVVLVVRSDVPQGMRACKDTSAQRWLCGSEVDL